MLRVEPLVLYLPVPVLLRHAAKRIDGHTERADGPERARGDPLGGRSAPRGAARAGGARGRARPREQPARRQAAAPALPPFPPAGRLVRRLTWWAAALDAAAATDRGPYRRPPEATRSGVRRAPRRPGGLGADAAPLGLLRRQRPDRQAQSLLPDRGAAADGPEDARLRAPERKAVPARAAQRRLGARALPAWPACSP